MTAIAAPPDRLPREGEAIRRTARKPDYLIDTETGCWVWQKFTTHAGYAHGRMHRRYYERAYGPIPPNHDIHHRCGNTSCLNPEHMEAAHERAHDIECFLLAKGRDFDTIRRVFEERRTTGKSIRTLSSEFGIPFATLRDWLAGETWSDFLDSADGRVAIEKVCEWQGCDNLVPGLARRPDKRFCCRTCRERFNRAKAKTRAASSRGER